MNEHTWVTITTGHLALLLPSPFKHDVFVMFLLLSSSKASKMYINPPFTQALRVITLLPSLEPLHAFRLPSRHTLWILLSSMELDKES